MARPPHPSAARQMRFRFWKRLVRQACSKASTPFFLFSAEPIRQELEGLRSLPAELGLPVRHWLSCKTQPVAPLLRWWRRRAGIEVVSEFELQAALREGYAPEHILVNGPAKHRWLARYPLTRLRVNFDSPAEMRALLAVAKRLNWSIGVRCLTSQEFDPEHPNRPTQFGMAPPEAVQALSRLRKSGVRLETVHFHLRTNVRTPEVYGRALAEIAEICRAASFQPKHVDCGGGWPPPDIVTLDGQRYDAEFERAALIKSFRSALRGFPGLEELWFENGRSLSAGSGVLVVTVLEVKERSGLRQLICDGGRTLHALISAWESHDVFTLPERTGPVRLTSVCGPTCMAFDCLSTRLLPATIRAGDRLIWMDAGAYHIPWETGFSHGRAAVLWHEREGLTIARRPESFADWWGVWE